jgi:valyl-tRNA synthetase
MPFITEEIWQKLPLIRSSESIVIAAYPSPDPSLADPEAEGEMSPLITAIDALRKIRSENSVAPSARIQAEIQTSDESTRRTLEKWRHYLLPLAGLSSVEIAPPRAKPPQAASVVSSGLEIFVPLAGLIDLQEERARLSKEIARIDADLELVRRRFENPNFAARAPRDVVEKDRAREAELSSRKEKLQENLNRIR